MSTFKKYLLFSLIFALINASLLLIFFVFEFNHADTFQYIATIKHFLGQPDGEIFLPRILKPLPIFIGVALAPLFGVDNVLIVQNFIFYMLSIWLIFLIVYRLYSNEKQSFYASVLFAAAFPMLYFGLASLTDMSGWFFYIFSIFIALKFLNNPKLEGAILAGLVSGSGMLFKESVAAFPIFFISSVFICLKLGLKEKIKYILVFLGGFIFFPIINGIFIAKFFSYSYWEWFRSAGVHPDGSAGFYAYTPLRTLIEMMRVFMFGWLFVFLGTLKEFKAKNQSRLRILGALILPSLSFFLWGFPHNRIAYIAAPLLVLLGSFGILIDNKKRFGFINELSLLFFYILINYAALIFFLKYGTVLQPPGTLFG